MRQSQAKIVSTCGHSRTPIVKYLLAINAATRYYVAAGSLLSERTTHIALLSLFQTGGFIMGPGLMVSPVSEFKIFWVCTLGDHTVIFVSSVAAHCSLCNVHKEVQTLSDIDIPSVINHDNIKFKAALGFLGHKPFPAEGSLVFDMYTSTGWVQSTDSLIVHLHWVSTRPKANYRIFFHSWISQLKL